MRQLDADHEALREAVRSLLGRHPGGEAWGPLAQQIGAAGLAVPEEYGGAGAGPFELHVVQEELGRVLSPVPFLGSAVLAARAVLASGDSEACAELLPSLADGSLIGAVAWAERGSWDPEAVRAEAVRGADGGWRVSGVKEHVLGGAEAGLLVVVARGPEGVRFFRVAPDAPGVAVRPCSTMDLTIHQASVQLDDAPARLLGGSASSLSRLLDETVTALAAEQLGAAGRALDLTVEYARTRVQFGRPIGSFQTVKHRLADAYVQLESARSTALAAADALETGSPDSSRLAAAAASACAEAFSAIAAEMIQLHGGIAITWEHDAHRYFKRAHTTSQLFGSPSWHRARLAEQVA